MIKNLLRTSLVALMLATGANAHAETTVTLVTDAAAGTELRLYSMPYGETTVAGADKTDYFGIYKSQGPGSTITLTGNIEELEVYGCQLTALTVADAQTMRILRCYDNKLESIDLSSCPELVVLNCKENKLESIDLSACTSLEKIEAQNNELSTVVTGNLAKLTFADFSYNKLVDIDMSSCPELADLYVQKNLLTTLDLSHNTKLWGLRVFGNELAGEAMDQFIADLPYATMNPALLYIVDTRDAEEGNLCLEKMLPWHATKVGA